MVEEEVKIGSDSAIVPEERKSISVIADGLLGGGADDFFALELEKVLMEGAPGERSG